MRRAATRTHTVRQCTGADRGAARCNRRSAPRPLETATTHSSALTCPWLSALLRMICAHRHPRLAHAVHGTGAALFFGPRGSRLTERAPEVHVAARATTTRSAFTTRKTQPLARVAICAESAGPSARTPRVSCVRGLRHKCVRVARPAFVIVSGLDARTAASAGPDPTRLFAVDCGLAPIGPSLWFTHASDRGAQYRRAQVNHHVVWGTEARAWCVVSRGCAHGSALGAHLT